ncbi:aldehyde oxidase GLOX1-like [Cornus florida]|uniref:aldehyde oxidase GLOX1-like n=1 Tax=Cornus florida TaxID=4283 RepID=UPI00289BD8F0|nr:aldehyde oxidase GLOX1-like [Cornus florida]
MTKSLLFSFLLRQLLVIAAGQCCLNLTHASGGRWKLLNPNIGISAMHMQLLHNDRVVIFDRTDFGRSNISLPNRKCHLASTNDCTAHSVQYDVTSNTIRPLTVLTDVWCSSGAVMPDGRLIQTGGFNDGEHVVRIYRPCMDCDWEEVSSGLTHRRWYVTNHILPDGRQIIVGGRNQFNYEFYPKTASSKKSYNLPFLAQTNEPEIENNLYPFVFLNVDGNLFIFANNRAILFEYVNRVVVRTYPEIPGGNPRNYPSTRSSVLLPLKDLQRPENIEAEVLVCGGAPKGSYTSVQSGKFVGALKTCGRIKITDPDPQWVVERMPLARVMGDMLLLPNGNVLIINGAAAGTAGWEKARHPVLKPIIYRPDSPIESRFEVQNPTTIPRLYHSTAIMLRDGRVLVGGSNPNVFYNFTGILFPTELSLEAFSPSYLDSGSRGLRPRIVSPISQAKLRYGQKVTVRFKVMGVLNENLISVTMLVPPFNTHSFSMNQRLLVLGGNKLRKVRKFTYEVRVRTPNSRNLAPSGYYLLFVVLQEIPSKGVWIHIQ